MAPIKSLQTPPPGALAKDVRRLVRARLYASMSPAEILQALEVDPAGVRRDLRQRLLAIMDEEGLVLRISQKEEVITYVLNDILGLGPIEPLLRDPTVTEIMVNGPYLVYVERDGLLERTDIVFEDAEHVMNTIDKIVAPLGRRVDESSPMVDARLPDGSRVNVVIPPLALTGPTITIRKFRSRLFSLDELVELGSIVPAMAEFFEAAVRARLNTIVTGGTGSGKTTFLNALSALIPVTERIITIEDSAELRFNQPHVVTLESRPANVEGRGRIAIRDLVINALRMRPDRLVVGEVRGGEALDMLQALNTGHDGSLTTAHANSPSEAISRLETMVLMAGVDLPVAAIRQQIVGGINLIVHLSRFPDGSRRVTQVSEVLGVDSGEVSLGDIFVFQQQGLDVDSRVTGQFQFTGRPPRLLSRLRVRGVAVPAILTRRRERAL